MRKKPCVCSKTAKAMIFSRPLTCTVCSLLLSVQCAVAGKKALYWDDAETLGKGKYQTENYFFYIREKDNVKGSYIFNFSYGLSPNVDIALNVPIGYLKAYGNTYSDMADPFFELKYKLYEKDSVKFAIKPFVGLPIKKSSRFSDGHVSYGITLVSQFEYNKLTFYANSSYMVHKDRPLGENEVFQSFSFEYPFTERWSLISSLYISSYGRTEKGGVVGFGYSKGRVEVGLGIGKVLSSRNYFSIYSGITFRFFQP